MVQPTLIPENWLSCREAGRRLGVGKERARQLAKKGELTARQDVRRVWFIDPASIKAWLSAKAAARSRRGQHQGVDKRLEGLARAIAELAAGQAELQAMVRELQTTTPNAALMRERDHYRAQAAAVRESALLLNSASRDAHAGYRHLLDTMVQQADALVQVLAPESLSDIS